MPNGKLFVIAKALGSGGYPEPTGTIDIAANGLVNVKDYAEANVQVPGGGALNWRDPLSINWDFANPVNTRGSASYASFGLIYTIDGWQLQAGSLSVVTGGIRLARYAEGTAGFFMQRFKQAMTSAFSGQTMTLSTLIDGVLYSTTGTVTSGSGNKIGLDAAGLIVRLYNYGSEAAITFDIDVGTESKLIQAVKFEAGSTSTLATQVGGVWVLNNNMDATTEFIRARDGTVNNG